MSHWFACITFEIAYREILPDEFPEVRVSKLTDIEYKLIPYKEDSGTGVRGYHFEKVVEAVDGPGAVQELEKMFSSLSGFVVLNANAYPLDPKAYGADHDSAEPGPDGDNTDGEADERGPLWKVECSAVVPLPQEAVARTWDNVYQGQPIKVVENRGGACLCLMEAHLRAHTEDEAKDKWKKSLLSTFAGLDVITVNALGLE